MCYPCSHCGACKVHLPKGACPFCGEPLDSGIYVCPNCGGMLPLPPGVSADEAGARVAESERVVSNDLSI